MPGFRRSPERFSIDSQQRFIRLVANIINPVIQTELKTGGINRLHDAAKGMTSGDPVGKSTKFSQPVDTQLTKLLNFRPSVLPGCNSRKNEEQNINQIMMLINRGAYLRQEKGD